MVKLQSSASQLDATFAALADPTRRAILKRLARGATPMGELARPFDMTWPAITKHVKALERANLVRRLQDGRVHRIELAVQPMRHAREWLDGYRAFWDERLDALDRHLSRK